MLFEFFKYFTSKTSQEARHFGHLYETIAIIQREKRCHLFWKSHREECKKFIIRSISKMTQFDSVIIFGAGPLHEIPIEEISKAFKKIDLVDVVHLPTTIKKCSHLNNINFITSDVTELEEFILKNKIIYNRQPEKFLKDKYDLVISANLISQIPHHLINFLRKNGKEKYSEETLIKFANQVAKDHFDYITNFHCPAILITDSETQYFDKNENLIQTEKPFLDFDLPPPDHKWVWNLAPIPEMSKKYSVKMVVSAFNLNFR